VILARENVLSSLPEAMGTKRNRPKKVDALDIDIGDFPREKSLLTPKQTAGALKITTRGLSNWARGKNPRLPSVKIGKSRRFIVGDVLALIEKFRIGLTK
jgi:hypothetical protein